MTGATTLGVLAVYAGYDDAALAALANPGLLRRARKELTGGDVSVAEELPDAVVLAVGAVRVRLDGHGPAGVTCSCPTAGTCQHVVTGCLWARESAAGESGAAVATPSSERPVGGGPDPVAELLALDPLVVHRQVGAAAVRVLAARWTDPDGEACTVQVEGPRAVVSWPGAPEVTYVAGAGVAGMVVGRSSRQAGTRAAGGPGASGAVLRLEAVVRVARLHGRSWHWPERDPAADRTADEAREVATEARAVIEQVLDTGLSHLGPDEVDAVRAVAVRARLARRPGLHRLLVAAAGMLADLVARSDDVDEAAALAACTEVWAFAAAPQAFESDAGDDEMTVDVPRLFPLGARWWRTPSGSRGVTFVGWDTAERRVRTVTTGRAAGVDPSFRRSWDLPLLWGRSLGTLSAGPVAVTGARALADGSLGAGGSPTITLLGEIDADELQEIAADRAQAVPAVDAVGFDRRPVGTRVVMLRKTGDVGVDEVRQELTWRVIDADGSHRVLRVPVADEHAVDVVLGVAARRSRVVAATIDRLPGRPDAEIVSLFVAGNRGHLQLVSPTLTPVWRDLGASTGWRRLHARVEALRSTAASHRTPREVLSPVEQVCATLADVVLALAATGRRRLSDRQAHDVVRAGRRAADLGLGTLERVAADLREDLDAAVVLRSGFLVGRARAVAHQLDLVG